MAKGSKVDHTGSDHHNDHPSEGSHGSIGGGKRASGSGADIYGDNPTAMADRIAMEGMGLAEESETNEIHGLSDREASDSGGDENVQERE